MSHLFDKILGKDKEDSSPQLPPSAPTMSETHPVVTEATRQTNPHQEEEHSFSFAKLKDALTGSSSTPKAPELPPQVTVTEDLHSGKDDKDEWYEKFKDLLDLGASNRREAEEKRLQLERAAAEADVAAREAEEKAHVRGKLKGLFKSDEEEAAEHERLVEDALKKRREAEEARRKEHSFSMKVKDVFDHDNEEKEKERQRLAEEAKRNQSFGARVRNVFERSRPPTPEPMKKHPWSRTPTPEPDWKDKLNNLIGGGAKAEQKEDKLDKAIDFYQEHVLHEGDQNHESLFEQAKDKEIASAIRYGFKEATGHKFPEK